MCHACSAGRYAEATAQLICDACPRGKFQEQTACNNCTACPVGYISSRDAATECTACASGTYTAEYGSASEADCAKSLKIALIFSAFKKKNGAMSSSQMARLDARTATRRGAAWAVEAVAPAARGVRASARAPCPA